tara:strand:- start:90215 stop:90568 length:354 start_codon:yes stop_codon:yes gene_type:complete
MSEINELSPQAPQPGVTNKLVSKPSTQGAEKSSTSTTAQDTGTIDQLSSASLEHRNKIMEELNNNVRPEVIEQAKKEGWGEDANWPSDADLDALISTPDLAKTILSTDTQDEASAQT